MKKLVLIFSIFVLIFCSCKTKSNLKNNLKIAEMDNIIENTTWFGQSSVKIVYKGQTVYFDPFNIKLNDKADVIFITHSHRDHFSPSDIRKIITPETKIFAPENTSKLLADSGFTNITAVKPFDKFPDFNLPFYTVPAYNVVKTNFHPKENNWIGYVVNFGETKVYHPGDTERIPEMKNIETDITFMPLGQTYTMNSVDEAVRATLDVKAQIAVPFHYGMYEGSKENAQEFKNKLSQNIKVVVLNFEP